MTRWVVALVAVVPMIGAQAYAQEKVGQGTLEVTAIPGGGTFFVSTDTEPSFGNYDLGGALTYKVSRLVSVEGELGGTLGVAQDLAFGGVTSSHKTPNMFGYSGNIVVNGRTRNRTTPYLTGGLGGLTVFQRTDLDVNDTHNFLTGNVGGGIKWYANDRWGLRGDYRFIGVRGADDGAAFFGQEARYGNRIYGGFIVNVIQ
jgi:hypothetical protein